MPVYTGAVPISLKTGPNRTKCARLDWANDSRFHKPKASAYQAGQAARCDRDVTSINGAVRISVAHQLCVSDGTRRPRASLKQQ